MTLSNAGPGGIPFLAGDDAETAMLDGESSITTSTNSMSSRARPMRAADSRETTGEESREPRHLPPANPSLAEGPEPARGGATTGPDMSTTLLMLNGDPGDPARGLPFARRDSDLQLDLRLRSTILKLGFASETRIP